MSTDRKIDNNLLTKMEEELNGKSLGGHILLHNHLEMQSESNQNPKADIEWRRGIRWTEQEHSSGSELEALLTEPSDEDNDIRSIFDVGKAPTSDAMLFNAAHCGMSGYAAAGAAPAQLPLFAPSSDTTIDDEGIFDVLIWWRRSC